MGVAPEYAGLDGDERLKVTIQLVKAGRINEALDDVTMELLGAAEVGPIWKTARFLELWTDAQNHKRDPDAFKKCVDKYKP